MKQEDLLKEMNESIEKRIEYLREYGLSNYDIKVSILHTISLLEYKMKQDLPVF